MTVGQTIEIYTKPGLIHRKRDRDMIVRKATQPTRCRLCLQDADAEVRRHLLENRPCDQPGCPLRNVINTALERQRNSRGIVFGARRRQPAAPRNGAPAIRRPAMPHAISKRTRKERLMEYIRLQVRRIREIWGG